MGHLYPSYCQMFCILARYINLLFQPTLVNTLSKLKRSFSSAFAKDDGAGNFQTSSPEQSKREIFDFVNFVNHTLTQQNMFISGYQTSS